MRRPRDIDAELRTLDERAKQLRVRKVTQLGELVIATRADALPVEELAGVLLEAVEAKAEAREGWRERGTRFFHRRGDDAGEAAGGGRRGAPTGDAAAPAPGKPGAP